MISTADAPEKYNEYEPDELTSCYRAFRGRISTGQWCAIFVYRDGIALLIPEED